LKSFFIQGEMWADTVEHPRVCNTGESFIISLGLLLILLLLVRESVVRTTSSDVDMGTGKPTLDKLGGLVIWLDAP
jgi:hypothetical protein